MPGPVFRSASGSRFWRDPVANVAALPPIDLIGVMRTVLDDGDGNPASYLWDGGGWVKMSDPDISGLTLPLSIANGGTSALTAAAARTNLDVPQNFSGPFHSLENPVTLQDLVVYLDSVWRPPFDSTNVGSTIYVDSAVGNDTTGDGTVGAPVATITRALMLHAVNPITTRTIQLVNAGSFPITGRVLQSLNRLTIKGPTPTTESTKTISGINSSSRANGLQLTVTPAAMTPDEHRGKLVLFQTGALSGKYGVIIKNDASDIWVTQDTVGTYLVPSPADTFDILNLGATITFPTGAFTFETSVGCTFEHIIFQQAGTNLSFNDTDQVTLRRCQVFMKSLAAGRGGSLNLHTSYVAGEGDTFTDSGMLLARTQGILALNRGTVVDGVNATSTPAAHILLSSFGFVDTWGEVALRDLGDNGILCRAGSSVGVRNDTTSTDSEWRFMDCAYGFRINADDEGSGGEYDLPDLFGNITTGHAVSATRGAWVRLGANSSVSTPGVGATGTNDISADDGVSEVAQAADGTYIEGGASPASGFAFVPNKTLTVAEAGAEYTTITAAIAAAVTGDVILVSPGSYLGTFTIPSGVSVVSEGGPLVTTITPTASTDKAVTISSDSYLRGFTIKGADGVGGAGVYSNATTDSMSVFDCIVEDCETGFFVETAGTDLSLYQCRAQRNAGETLDVGYKAASGASLHTWACRADGVAGNLITTGFLSDGADSDMDCHNIRATYCTNGLFATNGGDLDIHLAHVNTSTNGIRVNNASTANVMAVEVHNATTWHILIEDSASSMRISAGQIDSTMISIASGALYTALYSDAFMGDYGTSVEGEFHVGNPARPAEAIFGEGDSSTVNMHVFTTNSAGAGFIDETSDATDGTAYNIFQGTAAGHICYFGNSVRKFSGIKLNTSTAMVLGAGAIVWELSDGAGGWNAINIMATNSALPYQQYAQDAMARVEFDHIRFDPDSVTFGTNTVNGQSGYWLRARITVGITTAPIASVTNGASTKIHTNRSEINKDGTIEFFGTAEGISSVIPFGALRALVGSAPSSIAIDVSTNISYSGERNVYASNQSDGVVFRIPLPEGIDTSRKLTFITLFKPAGTGTGDVELELNVAQVKTGDTVDGTLTDINYIDITTIPVSSLDVIFESRIDFYVPDLRPDELMVIAHFRDAGIGNVDDTLSDNIEIVGLAIDAYRWRI